ncbi:DUF4466 family protein [Segetibacter sp.]|jgi:hypothetical protein|uniref:DUF4466 family protein n=1 Tax=Segetibacter sp. TaxID=2231182 RepID=UPI0026120C94|nr:DUF4466 family protein [Segetibacter sp.]MCW3080161.1 hypothetical protein [Segetibacter sp.]
MRLKLQVHKFSLLLLSVVTLMIACQEKEYMIPNPVSQLSNDAIKRSLGPNIVGFLPMEFAYAMALPRTQGKLVSAQVEASIAGATGTFLEHRSFYTNGAGFDVPVVVGSPSVNKGNLTSVTFNVDTNAATLRYYYVVPEEARGKAVSFTFSGTSSDGKTVSYKMGPYNISKMDIKRTLAVTNNTNAYISIEDMAVYNATNAATNASKIDLVYLYRAAPAAFTHALVSPAAGAQYLPGVTLPADINRSTKLRKVFGVPDFNLVRSFGSYTSSTASGNYIDDLDFQEIDLSSSPNFAVGMRAESGVWAETADGKYRAFIFVNTVNNNGSAVISMLRYVLK